MWRKREFYRVIWRCFSRVKCGSIMSGFRKCCDCWKVISCVIYWKSWQTNLRYVRLSLCWQNTSGAKVQVTGHRSHTKPIGQWTKLFLIDILLYKNKTSQGTSIIFFLFWTLPNPTHEKIYSCWSRKEDLRYSITKVGNEITKVCKIMWFVKKKTNLKTKGYCIKNIVTCLWMFWKVDGKTEEKL